MSEAQSIHSERLTNAGFAHAFSTRHGGQSEGVYSSLNLGRSVGDDRAHVTENHRRLATHVGYSIERLFDASQVHGATCIALYGDDQPDEVRTRKADALMVREAGLAVGVRTADCVPILVADTKTGAVAAIHAGWRGVVAGVVREAVRALGAADPASLIAAIGPSIGPCCFEVNNDVASQLSDAAGDGIVLRRGHEKPHVDLWRAVGHQLRRAGLSAVDTVSQCTMCDRARYYSYRRDGAQSGRMLSVIVARGAKA